MPSTITIIGLGPGSFDDLTLSAWKALTTCRTLILRTERHPCVPELLAHLRAGCSVQSCDHFYEQHAGFADVYAAIVAHLFATAETSGELVYAVPGHPWVGEATTPALVAQASEHGADVRVVAGLAFVEAAFAAVGVDMLDGSQVLDAMLLARQHYPQLEAGLPLLLGQVYARWLASEVKLTLLAAYPPDHPVMLIRGAATAQASLLSLPLEELDRRDDFDHLTSLYVPPLPAHSSFTALQELVAHLRAPEGCPWDREQSLETLRKDLLEEASELLEAIDVEESGTDNSPQIGEELGDLYLVATMLAQIAGEEGRFQMGDVMRGVITKLIRRHPHVFGDAVVDGVANVLANWDAIKAQERAEKQLQPGPPDDVPAALPALAKARKLQSKAAKLGLLDRHAVAQTDRALAAVVGDHLDADRLGSLLWQLVAAAHLNGLDAEDALRAHAVRFRRQLPAMP